MSANVLVAVRNGYDCSKQKTKDQRGGDEWEREENVENGGD